MPITSRILGSGISGNARSFAVASAGLHAYWRIRILSADDRLYEMAFLEMAESPGGADVCPGETIIHDSLWDSTTNVPANLIDGNDSTIGARVTNPLALLDCDSAWVGVQFASAKTIQEVRLRASSARPDRCPWGFLVQGSDDGTNWNTYSVCTKSGWTASEEASFSVGGTAITSSRSNARLWRVAWTEINGDATFCSIREVEFRTSTSGTDLATGGKAFSQKPFSVGEDARYCFDNNTSTQLTCGGGGGSSRKPGRVGYLFTSAADPATLALTHEGPPAASRAVRDFTVEWSVDADNWTSVLSVVSATGWTALETRTWAI